MPKNKQVMNLLWILAVVFILQIVFQKQARKPINFSEIKYSEFINAVENGKVSEVTIQEQNLIGTLNNGEHFKTFLINYDPSLLKTLKDNNVTISAIPKAKIPWYLELLSNLFPMLILIAVWIYFMRGMQGGGGITSLGKSKAKLLNENEAHVTFEDVAGIEEAKEELCEIVAFLKNHEKYHDLGGRIPKGCLLIGPPGTGKTLLARAIAGEAGVPFFSITGSDFVEMFVGVGASRVRDLFVQGKKRAPCIIFIDEIDAVGRHRGAGLGGGHDEREQTLNQLLSEMDGFTKNEAIIIIAATNRPDVLDPALLRPGRFDRRIVVPVPDLKGREGILAVHVKKVPTENDVDVSIIARGTPGFTGADLENLVNEAALLAAKNDKEKASMSDFEEAKDKVMMGTERRSVIMSEEEKRSTAYHESGHALVAKLIPEADPVHKVTIIPRGMALGLTQQLPLNEKHSQTRKQLLTMITILLGGRVAEELFLNDMSTGARDDLERATEIAHKMVCEFGMSGKLGPITFGKKDGNIFLGRDISQQKNYSEQTAISIDEEIRRIITEGYDVAKNLLETNKKIVDKIVEALLEKETINGADIDRIVDSQQ
jgi:cell division protease FtsH